MIKDFKFRRYLAYFISPVQRVAEQAHETRIGQTEFSFLRYQFIDTKTDNAHILYILTLIFNYYIIFENEDKNYSRDSFTYLATCQTKSLTPSLTFRASLITIFENDKIQSYCLGDCNLFSVN